MDDPLDLERDVAMTEFVENTVIATANDNVRGYLGTYGDAVEERVRQSILESKKLFELNYWGPSLTLSVTVIEILIRFLILRPLVQGAFLSEEWAEILSKRVATGRSAEDRELLPAILRQWKIEITTIKTKSNQPLWEKIQSLIKKRNDFVHAGEEVNEREAQEGLEAAQTLVDEIIAPIAEKFGFSISGEGKWHRGGSNYDVFKPLSPFKK